MDLVETTRDHKRPSETIRKGWRQCSSKHGVQAQSLLRSRPRRCRSGGRGSRRSKRRRWQECSTSRRRSSSISCRPGWQVLAMCRRCKRCRPSHATSGRVYACRRPPQRRSSIRRCRLRPAVASEAVGPVCLWSKWQLSSESPPWEAMFARLPASYRTERPTTDAQVPWDGTVAMASMGKVSAGMLGASGQNLKICITLYHFVSLCDT